MGPLYRSRRFQDTILVNLLFLISLSYTSSPLLQEEIADRLQKWAVERYKIRKLPVSQLFLVPKKNGNRSFYTKSVHKETTIQDGDSQVNKTVDNGQRLGCLHRPVRCLSSCPHSSAIQEVPSVHLRRSGLPIYGLTFRNVLVRGFSPN